MTSNTRLQYLRAEAARLYALALRLEEARSKGDFAAARDLPGVRGQLADLGAEADLLMRNQLVVPTQSTSCAA